MFICDVRIVGGFCVVWGAVQSVQLWVVVRAVVCDYECVRGRADWVCTRAAERAAVLMRAFLSECVSLAHPRVTCSRPGWCGRGS
jgi:hypothetical protein